MLVCQGLTQGKVLVDALANLNFKLSQLLLAVLRQRFACAGWP